MAVALTVPKVGPTELLDLAGTATLEKSTIAGMAIDSGQAAGSFANQTVDIKELVLSGPDVKASAAGTLALGETGESKLSYDVAVTNLEPLAKRFDQPFAGSAHDRRRSVRACGKPDARRQARREPAALRHECRRAHGEQHLHASSSRISTSSRGRFRPDTTATFVTFAGQKFPRVDREDRLRKERAAVRHARLRKSAGRWDSADGVLFHPDHDELHLRALNLTVGQTQWALPQGQEADREVLARLRDAGEFCAASAARSSSPRPAPSRSARHRPISRTI